MLRLRTLGLVLVAVFAFSAVVASAASAAPPEFGRCVAQSGGKYTESNCQTTGSGSFERSSTIVKKKFTSVSGAGKLETVGGTAVKCTGDEDEGEYTGVKTVGKLFVTFTGCKYGASTTCQNKGGTAGVIKTNELKGELGYIKKSTKEVGLSLTPAVAGGAFAEFVCFEGEIAPLTIVVKEGTAKGQKGGNSVIGRIGTVNTMASTFSLSFKQSAGVQEITEFEGGKLDVLESSVNGETPKRAGEETEDTITNEEAIEIFA